MHALAEVQDVQKSCVEVYSYRRDCVSVEYIVVFFNSKVSVQNKIKKTIKKPKKNCCGAKKTKSYNAFSLTEAAILLAANKASKLL
jgi:hypothetical protein